ncbi:MAG: Rpn family recombination-promoting nuclease/putative transposase [Lachnospiraceae bacterium]|nr:Rpn family recombination-promoting nuclease/putative transposase [Lachnospiraceae bacterium]
MENQDELNYIMPFRCMEYDVEDYAKQIRRIKKRHERDGDLKDSAEFLSGIKKEDKLNPVVTVIFYHGEGTWNTCKSLHDMLNFKKENVIMRRYTPNYESLIISLQEMDENKYETGLRELIGVMKRSSDKQRMQEYLEENQQRFQKLDDDTYDVISVMTNHKKLEYFKEQNRTKEGGVNMCKAFQEMEDEARERGYQDGIQRGIQDGMQQGMQQGTLLGEEKIIKLIKKLIEAGRNAEILAVTESPEVRKRLYQEFALV